MDNVPNNVEYILNFNMYGEELANECSLLDPTDITVVESSIKSLDTYNIEEEIPSHVLCLSQSLYVCLCVCYFLFSVIPFFAILLITCLLISDIF